jgi:hypothetical protein
MSEPYRLWEISFKGLVKSVSTGFTEMVVDEYVKYVIKTVANALKLDISLEEQPYINSNKTDHCVVAVEQESARGRLIGCNVNKLPYQNFGAPYVTDNSSFLVQTHSQMMIFLITTERSL